MRDGAEGGRKQFLLKDQTMSDQPNDISRRRALRRIGALAMTAYAAPAFTTLSVSHARVDDYNSSSSSASEPTNPTEPTAPTKVSAPSRSKEREKSREPSARVSEPSGPSSISGISRTDSCSSGSARGCSTN